MAESNPLSKLVRDGGEAAADRLSASMVAAVREAQRNIRLRVIEAAASRSAYAQSDRRNALYASIAGAYGELSRGLDSMLRGLAASVAQEGLMAADADIGTGKVVKYSPERLRRYWEYVRPGNGKSLAAVYTDKMTDVAIEQLRRAHIDIYRQAAVEGWTANQAQKAMQARWDELSGNEDAFRFVDKSGRKWENARYLQMLARTTAQRVSRDSYIDRLTEEGINIGRISSDGDEDCDICRVWEGVIVQLTGKSNKWPTWAEAQEAGVGHPNCLHSVQYIDDIQNAQEIRRQGGIPKVSPDNDSALVERKDAIDESRYTSQGMSAEVARRKVTKDRLAQNILRGTFNEEAVIIANSLGDATLDLIRKQGMPRMVLVKKGEKAGFTPGVSGGIVRVPRGASTDDVVKIIKEAVTPREPVVKKVKASSSAVTESARPTISESTLANIVGSVDWRVSAKFVPGQERTFYSKLTTDELSALQDYKSDDPYAPAAAIALNGMMREGMQLSEKQKEALKHLDSAFEKAPELLKNIVLYRGTEQPMTSIMIGGKEIVVNKGFVSTSVDREQAENFRSMVEGGDGYMYVIEIPAGSAVKAIPTKSFDRTSGSSIGDEAEVLLDRDAKFMVKSKRGRTITLVPIGDAPAR